MKRRHFVLRLAAGAALPAWLAPLAQAQRKASATPLGHIDLSLLNAAPRFEQFMQAASQPGVDDAQRFTLWQQLYDFLPAGDPVQQRAALDAAWPRYPGVAERVKAGFGALKPAPADMLGNIAGALRMEQPLKIRFVAFVGLFDGAVPTQPAAADGTPLSVFIPLENYDAAVALRVAEALSRIVTANMGIAQSNAHSVAESVVYGGLTRFAALAGDDSFTAAPKPPVDAARRDALLRTLRPLLADTAPDTLARVSGGDNDAAAAGWWLTRRWVERGLSLAEIARTPPQNMVKVTRATLDALLHR
ncbi:MAG: hypothetical protein KGJ44_07800 [Betaproteobacteria bacterium]|nr:hypothetical protein [Betaproteobacteria bacterium]